MSNTSPALASRSMFGVFTHAQWLALPKCGEASSAMINRMLGLAGATTPVSIPDARITLAVIKA